MVGSGQNVAYTYDRGMRRISQTVNGALTTYLWDEFSRFGDVVWESDSTNPIYYTLAGGRILAQDEYTVPDAIRYLLTDAQSSTRLLVDAALTRLNEML